MPDENRSAKDEAADWLASNVRSFLSSLPYTAPEALELQASVKLREPLEGYEAARRGES